MNRDDLEHLIRVSAEIAQEYDLLIVGSQSILGAIPSRTSHLGQKPYKSRT